jgi:uncharacterized protein YeaO (DUF488 family)
MIRIKRIYEPASEADGFRLLIDRLWPRGISKEKAKIDLWLPNISPSAELRKWFNHEPEKWLEFQSRFLEELKEKNELIEEITTIINNNSTVTFLFAAKNEQHNNAVVLQQYFSKKIN